jgi:predicted RNase H-like HicB family nuclease
MKNYRLACIVEKDEDGYIAYCPQLQGCYTQGETYEETIENLKDAMKLHIKDRLAEKEKIPSSDTVNFTSIEVKV